MTNITLSIDEQLLAQGRRYAQKNGITFNALVRNLVKKTVTPSEAWLDDAFVLMDETGADSNGWIWNREELYRV
ncbi:MAG: hypothetical protein LBC35_08100 [Coriobacteriales bacterium]|jgi:hypothetical protein|nr:hypothetical protein [Coriobacteriales bacterium]